MNPVPLKHTPLVLKCISVSLKLKMFGTEEKFVKRKVNCFTLLLKGHFTYFTYGIFIMSWRELCQV